MANHGSTADKIYAFIEGYIHTHRELSPSVREIAEGCYLGISTVSYHLKVLQAQGRIQRDGNKARSIRLVELKKEI